MEQRFKQLWGDVQTWFSHLTDRERFIVGASGAAVTFFLLVLILVSFSSSAATTRTRTAHKVQQLELAGALASSYSDSERARQEIERQLTGSNMSLASYIEDQGEKAGLKIPTMIPKEAPLGDGRIIESTVELTLTEVSIRGLHTFLAQVENGQPGVVKVKHLRLQPRAESQTLTAWATIASYRLNTHAP